MVTVIVAHTQSEILLETQLNLEDKTPHTAKKSRKDNSDWKYTFLLQKYAGFSVKIP